MRIVTFIEVDICHQMAPLRMLFLINSIFDQGENVFLLCICNKNRAFTVGVSIRFASTRVSTVMELLLFLVQRFLVERATYQIP